MENINPGEPLFPVASIHTGPLTSIGAVLIRFDFLTNPMQPAEQANAGRNYALTPEQARYLAKQIGSALATLQSASSPGPPGPTH